jgi:glycosyltransferase involved in cell wall biosynthesis
MKILMLTPYLPYPPSSGGQVRSYNLIKQLASKHEITLFSLIKDPSEKKFVKELEKYCRKVAVFSRSPKPWTLSNILRTGFSFYPFLVIRNLSEKEREALSVELSQESYDLIHAETFYVMPHLPPTSVPILLVDQTIEYQVYQHYVEKSENWFLKPLLYVDVLKIKYWESRFWKKADKVVAVSQADKRKMKSVVKDLDVGVVPNGAGEDLMRAWGKKRPTSNPVVFFQANFTWLQNVEAANKLVKYVFPLIRKEMPSATCWIVGQEAKEKVGKLASKEVKIINLEADEIKGVIDAYKKATVFVAPLRGPGGTRLKILAAMAAGVPVVTTKVGIEGIDAQNEKEVLIANQWQKMAEVTVQLMKDKELYQKIIDSARKLVEDKYSYQSIARSLEKIYQEVAFGKKN